MRLSWWARDILLKQGNYMEHICEVPPALVWVMIKTDKDKQHEMAMMNRLNVRMSWEDPKFIKTVHSGKTYLDHISINVASQLNWLLVAESVVFRCLATFLWVLILKVCKRRFHRIKRLNPRPPIFLKTKVFLKSVRCLPINYTWLRQELILQG